MNSYEREAIGDIVIIKGLVFENTAIGKKEPDHAWKDGRPCMIIYSDSENINRNIDNIENWFRVRLNSDDAKVYIENSI